jgi:hypothetical protein
MAILLGWEEAAQLDQGFDHVREYLEGMYPRWKLGTSYSGWVKALLAWSPQLLPAVQQRLRSEVQRIAGPHWKYRDWVLLAADGSRLECPRSEANEKELGCAGKERTTPQLMLTTLYHLTTGLPWAYAVGPGTESERRQLEALLPHLPPDTLLLTDAGFASYELCASLLEARRHFLLRVGSNVRLLTELGWNVEIQGQTVYLWPQDRQKQGQPPLVLRLIVLPADQESIYLITDLPADTLSDEEAGTVYRMRWGVEVLYRSYKRTMDHHKMRSRTPATCREELQWTLIAYWLMALMTVEPVVAAGKLPTDWSPAQSRNTLRKALRGVLAGKRAEEPLRAQLARAVKDQYVRHRPKKARNWPHKKREKPPGPPKIRPATAVEIQRAKQLAENHTAA